MAYIQPDSIIEFFGDINLSDKYSDSLYFPLEITKDSYFTNLTKLGRVLNCTYTRENRGYVRVELPMRTLIGATYMRFKNTSFENKWFYAFVKKVDYVNNQTTEVKFEIDPLMTWMGTFTLQECFIERQHTLRDGIGNNICEEGLPVGEYICEERSEASFGPSYIVIVYLENNETTITGRRRGGVYTGFKTKVCRDSDDANEFLSDFLANNLIDNIVCMYMSNAKMANPEDGKLEEEITISKPYNSLNGYIPRNKKLYCYPYKFLSVDNSEGDNKEYLYEYFNTLPDETSTGDCRFVIVGTSSGSSEVFTAPAYYNGVDTGIPEDPRLINHANLTERIGMSHFPQCAWGINSYEAYLAQKNAYFAQNLTKNGIKGALQGIAAGGMKGGGNTGTNMIQGGATGGLLGILDVVTDNFVENNIKPQSPSQARGSETVDALYSVGGKTFTFSKMCITKNYAMMLDSYFDMFGYAVRQHGVPNMNARPSWTYVKTIGCIVGGNIPADDAAKIETIFDNGIRFWKSHDSIGNYSLNNTPA